MTLVSAREAALEEAGGIPVPEVSIVIPVYYNAPSLEELHRRIAASMSAAGVADWDVTFVDDGSGDNSFEVLKNLQDRHPGIRVVRLSRNFGSTGAIQAGLRHARGRCVAVLAADLQDPPEMLQTMISRWRAGVKVLLATRESREDPWLTRLFSAAFYRLFRLTVTADMPPGGFDFFLVDQQVAQLLVEGTQANTNLMAALLWLGFSREIVSYHRAARAHGASMWTFTKKLKYMYDSLLSFSYLPLRTMTAVGLVGIVLAIVYGVVVAIHRITDPHEPPGWASLMVVTLLFDGLLLAAVGTVGEYVWRTFDAARRRPPFVIEQCREPTKPTAEEPRKGTSP